MTDTTNLGLKKFEDADNFNPDVLNQNWEKVDGAFVLKNGAKVQFYETDAVVGIGIGTDKDFEFWNDVTNRNADIYVGKINNCLNVWNVPGTNGMGLSAGGVILYLNSTSGNSFFELPPGKDFAFWCRETNKYVPIIVGDVRCDSVNGFGFVNYDNVMGVNLPDKPQFEFWKPSLNKQASIRGDDFRYNKLTQVSSAVYKTNIKTYDGALEKCNAIKICEYDRTDSDCHQLGVIVEDENTPEEIITYFEEAERDEEGNIIGQKTVGGIDMYSLVSMALRASQEHYAKREVEITAAQLTNAEMFEANEARAAELDARETALQLTMAELYEMMTEGAA